MRVHVYCVKRVCIRSFSGPYFPAFGLNTESSEVSLRIQSECEKMRPGETPKTDTFDAVVVCYDKIIYYRDIFRILSSICDRAFLQKQLTPFIRYIFWQKRTVTDVFFCRQYASLLTKSYSHSMNSMNQVRLKKSPYNTIREESWFGQGKKTLQGEVEVIFPERLFRIGGVSQEHEAKNYHCFLEQLSKTSFKLSSGLQDSIYMGLLTK